MHLHGMNMNTNLAGLEAASAAQRSASAQQAADVRKKLSKSAEQLETEAQFEELLINNDSDENPERHPPFSEKSADGAGNESGIAEERSGHKSFWA